MKKIFSIILIVLCFSAQVDGCEICGCGTGNYYIGLLPQFSRAFIGTRYEFSHFHTSMKNEPSQYSNDLFQTVEIWGGLNVGKRWQILALLPFNSIHQNSDDGSYQSSGIGDAATIANYKIFNNSSATAKKKLITQTLWLGVGIKLATGKFTIDSNNPALVSLANTQLGSGSNDMMLNAIYNLNVNRVGISTSINYKMNSGNADQYYFGNKFSGSTIAYCPIKKQVFVITPHGGLMYEHTDCSKLATQKVPETGGYLVSTAAGVDINIKNVTFGCNAQLPVSQNFASAQTNTKIKGILHITFSL
jgi:hypothetical protein